MNFDRFGALAQDLMYSLRVQYPRTQKTSSVLKGIPLGNCPFNQVG
ncbi:hypothetical protein SPLC1_S200410 [Arthrospira platensis C1]|uniref:Uncharacterized protein n=2 Tax=Limnospira TaxID=2596745 RepID=A0A9P1KLP3_9CYAN|nr:hypothetical protein AmaxDRAFT_4390 [Limnospira maxima CS-328]EKD08641.1 hypothetical protein SPLC1_S200410 [Arthrospira platensis C1]CDM98380.1 conserved protein of unknown function [Limnospira indica PCC 8005]